MSLAKLNGIPYTHVVTGVQFCDDVRHSFEKLGYTYGDLVYLPELFLGEQSSIVESMKVEFSNGCYAQYFRYSDAQKPSNCLTDSWMYNKNGAWYSEEDLVVWYFSQIVSDLADAVIIRDDFRMQMPKLRRFVAYHGVTYYECIHMDLIGSEFLNLLNHKTKYLVASEVLTEYLKNMGYSTLFLPPIYIDIRIRHPVISNVKRYLYVGNMASYKNAEQLIDIARELSSGTCDDISIDIYGGTEERFEELLQGGSKPNNLCYKGHVSRVPYELYDGYISTSHKELFANACVEAMSYGLKCICSDILLPYKYYHNNTDGEVSVCTTTHDFVNEIVKAYKCGFESINQAKFLDRYSESKVSTIFLKILNK